MLVGVLAGSDAHKRQAGGLDFLCDRHEVAVPAHDDDGAEVPKAADIFRGVEAQLDVGSVLCPTTRREKLDQFDRALEQRVSVPPEELPVAVSAVDCDGPK